MIIDRFDGEDESYILYLLETKKRITNAELCKALSLSTSTVRKKLAKMEQEGLLIRTYGGAASLDSDRDETIVKKSLLNIPKKKAIAQTAARHIKNGETIVLGGSSTVAELSPHILKLREAVVLTNSTVIANQISKNLMLEVHINSGIIRKRTGCVVGPSAEQLFKRYHADKAFLGCDSFDLECGAGSDNILVGKVERSMLECARERYILCDSTKLNQTALYSYAACHEITALITDNEANPSVLSALRERGVTVITSPILRS